MDADIKVQIDIAEHINKALSNFKKSPKERLTLSYIETRLESLETLWEKFTSKHQLLVEKYSDKDLAASQYSTKGVYDVTDEIYMDYKSALKTALRGFKPATPSPSVSNPTSVNSKSTHVKLPKITIPTFSGLYSEWMSFRDLFISLIHSNEEIDNVQKLHYLKGHLKGEAEQLLRHIPITNDSYGQCWTLLENRYNNKQYLVNCILNRFFGQKSVPAESSSAIKELLDLTNETLNALKGLGIDTSTWDVVVIYIVSQKLDQESRKQWEIKVSELASLADQLPTIKQFQEFLETKYHSLEFLDSKPNSIYNQKPRTTHSNYKGSKANPIHMLNVTQPSCVYCKQAHNLRSCKEFIGIDLNEKRNFVQSNGLCFNCLGSNHSVKHCRNTTSCQICHRRHHSLLHPKSEIQTVSNETGDKQIAPVAKHNGAKLSSREEGPSTATNIASHFVKGVAQQVLLATAVVNAESHNGEAYQLVRALIDQGSQASFITKAAVQLLGLKPTPTRGLVSGLGGEQSLIARSMVEVTISSRLNPGCVFKTTAYILDKLTAYLPAASVSVPAWSELECIILADPEYHTPNRIDILLGAEVYGSIIEQGLIKCPSGSLVAQNTALGWILSGRVNLPPRDSQANNLVSMHTQIEPVEQLLKSFWELEAEPTIKQKILSLEEQKCEDIYHSTTTRDADGRYVVKLPFRDSEPACADGQSREIALKRFHHLERKLQQNDHLKEEYKKVFNEYLQLNHMVEITPNASIKGLYLPYHAVIREDKETTKVRIVFDASCKGTNGVSLNDDLMVGPTLQPELRHLIMRWRVYPICFIADIVKMYRQVKVSDEDSEYQRILWRENPGDKIKEYKLLRVTFGTSSAPYLAVKSLIQVAEDEGKDFPLAAVRIKTQFYMDDLMSGCEEVEEAVELHKQINTILKKGGFELQKWSSNSDSLLEKIQEHTSLGKQEENPIEVKFDTINKILGLTWNRSSDEFVYAVKLPPMSVPVTKRMVISDISKLYDPLGWIAPSIILAKIFIQKLWLAGIDWDQELPPALLDEWIRYRESLSDFTCFRQKRWIHCRSDAQQVELHGFSDASTAAFGAVVYLRVIDAEGKIHVSLVTAKTKVDPIKQVSVPRLELCAAVLLAKLLAEVSEVLSIPKSNQHAWTDSEVVLAWLSSHPSRWKTFVGNRCSEILSITDRSQWAHVRSEHNPADCASRGVPASALIGLTLWLQGPPWLREEIIQYPKSETLNTNLEQKQIQTHLATSEAPTEDDEDVWAKFSALTKLLRVVAYCRRALRKEKPNQTYLLKKEIDDALEIMIRKCQAQAFSEEIKNLKEKKSSWAVLGVLLNMLGQGMMLSFPSILLPGLKAEGSTIKTDLETMSWLASVVGLACIPGFLISAFFMEVWGRRPTQALVIIPGTLGWILIYIANDVPTLMAGRILGGITGGASVTLGAVVIGEYTSPQLRGMFLNLKTAAVCVGNTVIHIAGHYYSWRTVAIFGLIPHIIAFGIVCTWPESPTWLVSKCRFDQSEKAWLWLRGDDQGSRNEFDNMTRAQKLRLSEIQEKPSLTTHVVTFLQKFTKKDFLKPLLIMFFAGILLETCGRHLFPAYALQIIEDITGDKSRSFYYTLIIDVITTFSATFSSALVRMLKRRTLLFLTGGVSLGVLMCICGYLYMSAIGVISKDRAWLPVSMFMLYFLLANLGCTPIPLALFGEVFPVAHRGAGSAISGLLLAICLMVTLKTTPAMLVSVQVYGTFAIFGTAMGLSLVVLYFILPETKDRTLQEIEEYFNHGRFIGDDRLREDEEEVKMLKN